MVRDYPIPNLKTGVNKAIGKYGVMKLKYLKDHHQGYLFSLQNKGKLNEYLSNIDIQANKMFDTLIEQYKNAYHINEELKESNEIV